MKSQTMWWILGGVAVIGAGTAIYFATRDEKDAKKESLTNGKGAIDVNLPEGGGVEDTKPSAPTIQDLANIASTYWGNAIDWMQQPPSV